MKGEWKKLLAWFAVVILLSGPGNAKAADLKAVSPARPATKRVAPRQTVTSPAAVVMVTGIKPSAARVTAGGAPVTFILTGSNLHQVTAVQVLSGAAVSSEFTVRLDRGTTGSRQATVTASANAAPGDYTLQVLAGNRLVSVPQTLAGMTVAAASKQAVPSKSDIGSEQLLTEQMKLQAAEPSSDTGRTGVETSSESMSALKEDSLMFQEMNLIHRAAQDDRQAQENMRDTAEQTRLSAKNAEIAAMRSRMEADMEATPQFFAGERASVSPLQTGRVIGSGTANYCIDPLHRNIRATFDQLTMVCSSADPSYPSYDLHVGQLEGFKLEWFTNNRCQVLDIPFRLKEEVRSIYSSGMAEADSSCTKNCLNTVDGVVSEGRFREARDTCLTCCDFLPEVDRNDCQAQCRSTTEEIFSSMSEEAKGAADSAKEQWKKVLQVLREMADRQEEAIRTITN